MSDRLSRRLALAAAAAALLAGAGCASTIGTVAGATVGAAGWATMKTGKFAAKTTVKGAKAAGHAVSGGGSHSDEPQPADQETRVSQAEGAALTH